MQINQSMSFNFQARGRMPKSNVDKLAEKVLSGAAGATAVAASGSALYSIHVAAGGDIKSDNQQLETLNQSYQDIATSSPGGRYDNAGYLDGIPAQSTIFPSVPSAGAAFTGMFAGEQSKEAFGVNSNETISNACESSANNASIGIGRLFKKNSSVNKNLDEKEIALAVTAGAVTTGMGVSSGIDVTNRPEQSDTRGEILETAIPSVAVTVGVPSALFGSQVSETNKSSDNNNNSNKKDKNWRLPS